MASDFTFETATKDQAKARIALAGPSGSGKTWTALLFAARFGGPVAVIDTERGSASKYASDFAFDRLNMTRYDPRDVPKALAAAAAKGYPVVIIDSLSRFWSGEGGMLEQVDNAAKRSYGGNGFAGWKDARPMENAMVEAMLSYPGHVIVTMRTKTAYEIVTDDRGRKAPTRIGLKPEQRDGIEYEFDIVGDMDLENTLTISKTRCSELNGMVIRRPDAAVAETILEWLGDGKPAPDATEYRDQALTPGATAESLRELWQTVRGKGLSGSAVIDEHGDTVTLGDLIARRGKEAADAVPVEVDEHGAMTFAEQTRLGTGMVPETVLPADDSWDAVDGNGERQAAGDLPKEPGPQPPKENPTDLEKRLRNVGAIQGYFKQLGVTDRDARLRITAELAGIPTVVTTKDLTVVQGREVIAALGKCKNGAALDALLRERELAAAGE